MKFYVYYVNIQLFLNLCLNFNCPLLLCFKKYWAAFFTKMCQKVYYTTLLHKIRQKCKNQAVHFCLFWLFSIILIMLLCKFFGLWGFLLHIIAFKTLQLWPYSKDFRFFTTLWYLVVSNYYFEEVDNSRHMPYTAWWART